MERKKNSSFFDYHTAVEVESVDSAVTKALAVCTHWLGNLRGADGRCEEVGSP